MEDMKVTREQQKTEALRRLKVWGTDGFAAEALENGAIAVFDRFYGFKKDDFIVLASRAETTLIEKINELEAEYGIYVYMVVRSVTEFGELYDCIYVGRDDEDWVIDAALLEDSVTMSYCINVTIPEFSEFGTIGLGNKDGGMYRNQ